MDDSEQGDESYVRSMPGWGKLDQQEGCQSQ